MDPTRTTRFRASLQVQLAVPHSLRRSRSPLPTPPHPTPPHCHASYNPSSSAVLAFLTCLTFLTGALLGFCSETPAPSTQRRLQSHRTPPRPKTAINDRGRSSRPLLLFLVNSRHPARKMALGFGKKSKAPAPAPALESTDEKLPEVSSGTKNADGSWDGWDPEMGRQLPRKSDPFAGAPRKMSRLDAPRSGSIVGLDLDSDTDSNATVSKQIEMEADNAIKYRTCSWQKVRRARRPPDPPPLPLPSLGDP